MKCSKCGEEDSEKIKFCTNCGAEIKQKQEKDKESEQQKNSNFCPTCGKKIAVNVSFCPDCGQNLNDKSPNTHSNSNSEKKSKICAGLLGIFLGALGIHNFYLGYTSKGVAQILLSTVGILACGMGPVSAGIWGLVEGIMILAGSINQDADGNDLQD